ncbi:uncharacterized protein LOC124161411 [Ischnura elegans]|uniref:uncharacterized protein LOC124161408 n=1 Tax=Ischnura elegans TaxID=197161 RepID=UPI001ED868E8|nr:uncharacterized protein LOC124161408 [Ischnura elegans]XP_046393684.1 uncharacterized protein LOC124161411 [Ischnura elegans]
MDDKYEKITPEEIEREIQAANLYSWEDDDHSDYDDPPSSIKNDFRCSTPVTANREFPDGFWSPNGEVFAAVGNTEEISSTAETVIIDAATYDDDHDTEAEIQDSLILSFELSEPLSSDYCTCAICDSCAKNIARAVGSSDHTDRKISNCRECKCVTCKTCLNLAFHEVVSNYRDILQSREEVTIESGFYLNV